MILLDSNVVIYLRNPSLGEGIAHQFSGQRLFTCNVVVSEVLGFSELELTDARYFEELFAAMKNCLFDNIVTKYVIELRKTREIQLSDAIIAGTALANDLTLWTHNTEDFNNIPHLRLFDPLIS